MSRPLIGILRGIPSNEVAAVGEQLIHAGITRIQIPLQSSEALMAIEKLADAFSGRAQVGAGTVLTVDQVRDVTQAGAQLIVSPDCNPAVIDATKAAGLQSIPGVMTPTEAFTAVRHGADMLKVFPGTMIRPAGLRALKMVLPSDMPCLVAGGAAPDNFGFWLDAGADGFGVGSSLYQSGYAVDQVLRRAQIIVAAYDALVAQ